MSCTPSPSEEQRRTNMQKHAMYRANHKIGGADMPFAKCLCGAVLEGLPEIEEHQLLINMENHA
jgi:hypothetical protein